MVAPWIRRSLAIVLAAATALVVEDVIGCWVAGAPARAWGWVALSPMRLASFLALACVLAAATWLCWAGVPQRWNARLGLYSLLVLGVFLGNGRYVGSNDVAATRLIPFVLGREGRLTFEHSPNVTLNRDALPYWFVPAGEHVVSRYPVTTGVLAVPVYLPALAGSYDPTKERVHELERIAAALLALGSVLIVAAIARKMFGDSQDAAALAVTSVYAFGTNVATVLSKALWQHTGGAFGFSLALAGLFLARTARCQAVLLGAGIGIAVAARITNAAPALFIGLAAVVTLGWRSALLAGALACVPVAAQLGYSLHYFGSVTGNGYGHEAIEGWTGNGWLGLLLSPGRGLLLYSPCLAFACAALARERERIELRTGLLLLAAGAALLSVMGRWWCWWGGGSPGDRMTSDITPIWGVGLALAHIRFAQTPSWRAAWLSSCAYACVVHALIVFVRPSALVTEHFIRVMGGAWSWNAYAPVTYTLGMFGR